MTIDAERLAFAALEEAKCRAIELYRTTKFSAGAIARDAGVSKVTLYRWLHEEGIPLRRHANSDVPLAREGANQINDVTELRRSLDVLAARLSRLERLNHASL